MLPVSGYGASLIGVTLGTFPNVKDIKIGGLEVEVKEVACVTDPDKIPAKLLTKVRDGNIDLTMLYTKSSHTLYSLLRAHAKGHTQDMFTLEDGTDSAHAGLGYVTKVGEVGMDTDNEMVYQVTLTPVRTWDFIPAA